MLITILVLQQIKEFILEALFICFFGKPAFVFHGNQPLRRSVHL